MSKELIGIRPLIHSGSDDLESFLAWSAQIKLEMSEANPLLDKVLQNLAFSMHPIAGGDSFRTHSARELQIRSEGRQLGCLLVQRTKGETQLRVTKWLSATNGWKAWRQLNLSFLSRLLSSLLHVSFDDEQPASFLQPLLAWKELMVEHQELSESSLNMIAIATCQKEQEELGEHNRVNFQENSFQQQQKQDRPDQLVEGGQEGTHSPQPPAQRGKGEQQLPNSAQRTSRAKREELGQRGKEGRRKQQEKGEAYSPQPRAYQGKGKHARLPTQEFWCSYCWKKGHTAQACWWNASAQQQKHQQKNTLRSQRREKQLQKDHGDQPFADWLASNKSLMSSFEKQTQDKSLAMLETLDNSLAAEPWALLVDTGAATSVAPQSFAPHLELSPAPSTFQLATATGEAIKIFGLRHVHLQCQDLSFKVSFVIADVVTPILGLDTLMQHNLSLSFEHDQRFLVDKTGKRTQLEHMGRHLYLVACPLQHGLSTCFRGSLSDVIGFLPEDKEIHEQETALRSSSSTDLVEDRSFSESLHVHDQSSFVCVLCHEEVAVSGGELSDTSLHPCQQSKQPSSQDEQLHNKHPRSSLHRSEELEEAKGQELIHALSSACVYDLPDLAWKDPACVFRGHLSQSQLSARNSGQQMTHKLAARKGTRSSKSQVATGAESSTALHTVVSVGSPASFGGASLVALMVQLSVPSPLAKSELAYEESLKETEEALANTSLLQPSPVPSLTLTSLKLESLVARMYSSLCFQISMLVASIVKRDRFQLWGFQLTRAQLCRPESAKTSLQQKELARAASTAEKSLQQKALAAAYALTEQLCFMAQSHEDELTADRACGNLCFSPTRARQSFQLTRAQLCRQQSPDKSLQQRELAAAYALMAQFPECSTRASPIQLDAFRTGALQESGFQTGALPAAGSKAALETGFAATAFQDPGTAAAAALNAEKLQAEDRITRNFSRTRVDELEETTNFAAIGQELAKYIANLREISQKLSPKIFASLRSSRTTFHKNLTSMLVK